MKSIFMALWMALMMCCGTAKAVEPAEEANIRKALIEQLEVDKVLTAEQAASAVEKYAEGATGWFNINGQKAFLYALYILAGASGLYFFFGVIVKIAESAWWFICLIPKEVYQAVFAAFFGYSLYEPAWFWASKAHFVMLFSAFAFPIVVGWILATHEKLVEFLANIFKLGIPVSCIISAWLCVYFGVLAVVYQTQFLGFFAAVALSGVFSFGLTYRPGVLSLEFHPNMLKEVIFGHLIVLGGYLYMKLTGNLPEEAKYFAVGIEYYCSIALGVGLLCGASPWWDRNKGFYAILFVVVAALAFYGFFALNVNVIGSIMLVFATLFVLEWIMYMGFCGGALAGSLVMFLTLGSFALMLERYLAVLNFKM